MAQRGGRRGRAWGPIRTDSQEKADLCRLLRELIDTAPQRRSLRELQKPLHFSASRLSEFFNGTKIPPWQVVERLVRVTVRPEQAQERLREARKVWKAAQDAPKLPVPLVVPTPPAQERQADSILHELIGALRTVAELERAKAAAEKLALLLTLVNGALQQQLTRAKTDGDPLLPEPAGSEQDVRSLQAQAAEQLAQAHRKALQAEKILRSANKVVARLRSELLDLQDRGLNRAMPPAPPVTEGVAEGVDIEDASRVLERAQVLLTETGQDLDRLQASVGEQLAMTDPANQTPIVQPKAADNPVTSPDKAHAVSRRRIVMGWAAGLSTGAAGVGIFLTGKWDPFSFAPPQPTPSPGPRPERWAWSYPAEASLQAYKGLLVASRPNTPVVLLDAVTGRKHSRQPATALYGPPLISGTTMYGDDGTSRLIAMDIETGTVRWTRDVRETVNKPPILVGDTLYVTSETGHCSALNATSGKLLWRKPPQPTLGLLYGPPVVTDGIVIVGYPDRDTVYGLDAATGERRWTAPTAYLNPFSAAVVLPGHRVVVEGDHDEVLVLDTRTGKTLVSIGGYAQTDQGWPQKDSFANWPPRLTKAALYYTTTGGRLHALDPASLDEIWRADTEGFLQPLQNLEGSPLMAVPTISDGRVYLGTKAGLSAYNGFDGTKLWTTPVRNGVYAAPAVHDGTVYAGGADGTLYAIAANTGTVQWKLATDGPIVLSPLIANRMVYVVSRDKNVYAAHLAAN